MDYLRDAYQVFAVYAYAFQDEFFSVAGITLLIAISFLFRKTRREWKRMIKTAKKGLRGKIMTKEEREAYNARIQGDAIYEALSKLVDDGQQTQHDVKKTLRRLATVLNIPDFISAKNLDFTALSGEEFELIQSILRSKKELQKLLFAKQKPRIPGGKPGEVDNVMVYQKRAHALAEDGMNTVKFGGNLRARRTAVS